MHLFSVTKCGGCVHQPRPRTAAGHRVRLRRGHADVQADLAVSVKDAYTPHTVYTQRIRSHKEAVKSNGGPMVGDLCISC